MNITTYSLLLLIALLLLTTNACKEDDRNRIAVERVINEEVTNKANSYRQSRTERCKEKAIKEANEIADSILLLEARLARDTVDKPPKPTRPEKPEIKVLKDSTPVQPIIKRDSNGRSDPTAPNATSDGG